MWAWFVLMSHWIIRGIFSPDFTLIGQNLVF